MSLYTSKKWEWRLYSTLKLWVTKYSKSNRTSEPIPLGMTMPSLTGIQIGAARRMSASILFFDLASFTSITSRLAKDETLKVLNIIIPTMMHIVRAWNGEVEKNTGDGIMALLGTETRKREVMATDAVECALTMKYIMKNEIQPVLSKLGLPAMQFRIGVDLDEVLIARMGISGNSFLAAIGDAANRASKLQELAESDCICIGDNVYSFMPDQLKHYCRLGEHSSWQWKTANKIDYRYFHLDYDWPTPEKKTTPFQPPPTPSPYQLR